MEPHDLLVISSWKDLQTKKNEPIPMWVKTSLDTAPIVVVRRAKTFANNIPVGVRGCKRRERFATYVSPQSVKILYRPSDLLQLGSEYLYLPQARVTFQKIQSLFDQKLNWGPAGSAGYEIASRQIIMNAESDFDIVIDPHKPLGIKEAQTLVEKMDFFPMYVDTQVKVSRGSFSLREWAKGKEVMLKSTNGPLLVNDPWSIG
ncbi:malonate decarboxylase holo-ACP synthase [Salicibibacter cibi]|nr:malonate decarboxylase holo-ACP synthase [Salicibibacter cibi]